MIKDAAPPIAAAPIKDAATILLLRGQAPFDIFMLKRGRTAQFMARAMVFPGGRVDASDRALAGACDLSGAEAAERLGVSDPERAIAFFVAAIRETFEEAGVLLADGPADGPDLDPARLAQQRDALNAKQIDFAAVVAEHGLTLRASQLGVFAHWITPPIEKRRYDTWFFVAQVPDAQAASHDAIENTAGAWLSPAAALTGYAKGTLRLAPPTLWELTALAECADRASAMQLRAGVPAAILPQPRSVDDELHLVLPADAGYDPPGPGRARVILRNGRWILAR